MSTFDFDAEPGLFARMKIIGVGGAGKNAVNHMVEIGVRASISWSPTRTRRTWRVPMSSTRYSWDTRSPAVSAPARIRT